MEIWLALKRGERVRTVPFVGTDNAPRRTLLLGSSNSFVTTVPAERPVRIQAGIIKLSPCRSRSQVNLKFSHFTSKLYRYTETKIREKESRAKLLCFLNLLAQLFKQS